MNLNCVKLGRAVTFMKYIASAVSLIVFNKNFNLEYKHVLRIKFAESCTAGDE